MWKASLACGLLALGLLGYAGYRYAVDQDTPPRPPLVVDQPDRDLGAQPSEACVPVWFRITNRTSQPVQVSGLVPG